MTKEKLSFGLHTVSNLLEKNPQSVRKLCLLKSREDKRLLEVIRLAEQSNINIEWHDRHYLDKITKEQQHQGAVAFCQSLEKLSENDLLNLIINSKTPPLLLILDSIQDPHNLGACLRTADAAGVSAVIAPKDRAVGITSIVEKVASGAASSIPFVQVTNLARTLKTLKQHNIWIYGLSDKAKEPIFKADFKIPTALVMGAEGKGIRKLVMKECDVLYQIPMQGTVSSLNVSVATGVCLYEAVRQRMGMVVYN